jgi:hypothetical protein
MKIYPRPGRSAPINYNKLFRLDAMRASVSRMDSGDGRTRWTEGLAGEGRGRGGSVAVPGKSRTLPPGDDVTFGGSCTRCTP